MIICLIRHGQTNWNKLRRIQGRTDNPLNEQGIIEAQEVANYLLKNDPNWDYLYTSPLARAKETGKIIAETLKLPKPMELSTLTERHFGEFEGTTINDQTFPTIMKEQVKGLETKVALQKRVLEAIYTIYNNHQNDKILITTHSHFIKGVLSTIIPDFDFGKLLYNGSLSYLEVKDQNITILAFNQSPK
ncbi:MAG: histidine phosphatase family protein [Bacilli bacterium]